MTKVMRKEARHTQRRDRASGVPLEILDTAAKSLQSCPTLCDPQTAAQQAPPSLGQVRRQPRDFGRNDCQPVSLFPDHGRDGIRHGITRLRGFDRRALMGPLAS